MRLETALRTLRSEQTGGPRARTMRRSPRPSTAAPKEIFRSSSDSSAELAETIDRFGVSAVLHGHAHLGTYAAATEKGIPVYNCSRSVRNRAAARTL